MPRLIFVVESGTDVRMIDGLSAHFQLLVLARKILGAGEISWPPASDVDLEIGPTNRLRFAKFIAQKVGHRSEPILVQGYGAAALAVNLAARRKGASASMLVCSPTEAYYQCRRLAVDEPSQPFSRSQFFALRIAARINAHIGRNYITLSEYLADVVRSHGTKRPINVIPVYGVDTTVFRPTSEGRASLRQRLRLPESGSIAFFSSRVAPEKDSATLLEAHAKLLSEGRDVWILHRSGGHEDFLQLATRAGVAERVITGPALQPTATLADFYRASDVCVQASRADGLGFSVLEALSCETPVVAAAVGGLRETIRSGDTGFSYQPGASESLSQCMRECLDNRTEAMRRSRVGRAMVAAQFESRSVFQRLADHLKSRA